MLYWSAVSSIWGLVGVAVLVAYNAAQLPPIDQLTIPKQAPNIAILGDNGSQIASRGASGPSVRLSRLPPYLPAAFVAIEDRRFYQHGGVDPLGIARAAVFDLLGHGGLQGGSTLTQQLARNLFLTQRRTIARKIQEAILAIWLEHRFSKSKILELYLNRVYFGSGAYGIDAAAEKYFGRSARHVSLAQAAMLAGLMKAPSQLEPDRNPLGAERRAAEVVHAMLDQGKITAAMARTALAHPAIAVRENDDGAANYAADYVMDQLNARLGGVDRDLVVRTTIDPRLETAGARALAGELDREGARFRVSQGALVAIDPSGAIKALIGGRNYRESQFDRAVEAKRQPGSAFKPFVYLSALERGLRPDSIRDDAPINVRGWTPEDASRRYLGPVTLTRALSLSLNTVAVRLGLEVGPKAVVAMAHRLGIASRLRADPSIALGTSEVSPLELAGAYVAFANGGLLARPHVITQVTTTTGKVLYRRRPTPLRRIIRPRYVAMMNAMMEQTLLAGTAKRADLPGWTAAGKTGTSQDYRDAWFLGYTARLVAGVWVGNDDSSPMKRVVGGSLPAAIWRVFMAAALKGSAPAPLPDQWRRPPPGPLASFFSPSAPRAQERSTPAAWGLAPIGGEAASRRPRNIFQRLFGG